MKIEPLTLKVRISDEAVATVGESKEGDGGAGEEKAEADVGGGRQLRRHPIAWRQDSANPKPFRMRLAECKHCFITNSHRH